MSNGPHILIVDAPYYTHIVEDLVKGAASTLEAGGATWSRISVSGAFEVPVAIRYAVQSMADLATGPRYDGYLALGCVIRGETTHYDHICEEANRALMQLCLDYRLAIGNGILTVENEAQALARAKADQKNKGGEAARAVLRMIQVQNHFGIHHK
ncbi:6,7-dimethyl-8-ribityllumazine synthase [Thalassospira alkalitolerans]|uniref:6,7-dimethyl-8-ribityllumazine synthase n=1 Tax=Thalassospira alkalitolerans TaxID=1293890 RepID=A0A1Y2LCM5_9PROT|nr:6,7-dimethyl-8-ribityllumazine synthase [Thalassospira alkalitolerans]OSQ48663.1 6,7-dimethyl-8-ribityllumazine synthase [Thalassospira alkalitolerans]|tara:strand:+ start:119610 stop:120074 length:465 start_codon:yes stop_codon:yes gene_type:complete